MFPLTAASSASWAILSTKFLLIICSDISPYFTVHFSILFLCFFLCLSCLAVVIAAFLVFLSCIFWCVSAESHSFCSGFLQAAISSQAKLTASFISFHCELMSKPSSSSCNSCRIWYLLDSVTLNLSAILTSLRKSTLYCALLLF